MYAANHYVKAAGKVYTAGEILPELPEDKIQWLLRAGAIQEVAPGPGAEPEKAPEEPTEEPKPEEPEGIATDAGEAEAEEAEEPDDDAEPEEIDVMAGIVREPDPEPVKKPASKSGRKSK